MGAKAGELMALRLEKLRPGVGAPSPSEELQAGGLAGSWRAKRLKAARGEEGVNLGDEVVLEEAKKGDRGVDVALGGVEDGSWYSWRTTRRVRCRALRASRLETYSRASTYSWGNCCESRSEVPASSGEDIRNFNEVDIVV